MFNDLVNLNSLLRINFQKFRDKVASNSWKALWPLNFEGKNVAEELVLTSTFEWRAASQQLKEKHSEVPHV